MGMTISTTKTITQNKNKKTNNQQPRIEVPSNKCIKDEGLVSLMQSQLGKIGLSRAQLKSN